MPSLDVFLDTGALPFIGRTDELDRLVAFWRASLRADAMRVMVIEGEAGVGKSRLVQEAIERIEAQQGTVVHAKLYAELTAAIAPIVHEALARTELGRRIARAEASLGAASDVLRRLARLRPTLLVIEDVHLLGGAPLRELVQLLEGVEEEPLAVLLTARTQEYPTRLVLDRWSLETLTLEPLEPTDVATLWRDLFGEPAPAATLEQLARATLGNPLALRSALRGAIRREALRRDSRGAWHAEPSFGVVSERSATSLVEGMLIAVGDDDRRAAARLASLGEVFSREAASSLVDTATLARLSGAGLVHELPTMKPPLPGLAAGAHPPLAFSHSLVHRALADDAAAAAEDDPAPLVSLLASRAPLYSIRPIASLAGAARLPETIDIDETRAAIDVLLALALELDRTADWELAMTAHQAAARLLELAGRRIPDDERRARAVAIAARELALMRRRMASPEYGEALDRLGALIADGLSPELEWYRLTHAIADARRRYLTDGYAAGRAVYEEVRSIVAEHPGLRRHQQYVLVLQTFAQLASENDDTPMRREVEREYRDLVADESLDESHRILAQTQVPPYLLTLFETPDELAGRERMYDELKALEHHPSPMARLLVHAMLPGEPAFLARTGRVDELVAFVDSRLALLRSQGMLVVHSHFRLYRLWAETLLGLASGAVLERLGALLSEYRAILPTAADTTSDAARIAAAALVRGDLELAGSIVEEHAITPEQLPRESARLLGVEPPLELAAAHEAIARPIIEIDDIVALRARLAALERSTLTNVETNRGRAVLASALAWLESRRLDAAMRSLLDAHSARLAARDAAAWRRRAAAIASEREAALAPARDDEGLRVTMLGRIEVVRPGESEPVQPRGARQKSFLGAMVAREMLARPLDRDEFLEAAGIERSDDPKLARDAVNSAIYRLRDVVGHDAVLTDEETPRLNMALVRVDLVDAWRALTEAEKALRRGSLALASRSTLDALETLRGEVPFPALYETLFEALREEIDNRRRSVTLAVARRLVAESDAAGAVALLERSFAITPDDEELAELYCEALEAEGRRAEAERVRRRVEAELG